jgi:hypothetical protein
MCECPDYLVYTDEKYDITFLSPYDAQYELRQLRLEQEDLIQQIRVARERNNNIRVRDAYL